MNASAEAGDRRPPATLRASEATFFCQSCEDAVILAHARAKLFDDLPKALLEDRKDILCQTLHYTLSSASGFEEGEDFNHLGDKSIEHCRGSVGLLRNALLNFPMRVNRLIKHLLAGGGFPFVDGSPRMALFANGERRLSTSR